LTFHNVTDNIRGYKMSAEHDHMFVWGFLVVVILVIAGVYFAGIDSGPPPCKTLIGFHVQHDGSLKNVYGPCGHDEGPDE
jgi:hypothetical protein